MTAVRLLLLAAEGWSHIDGIILSRGGRGVGYLTPREVCNVAFAIHLDGMTAEERSEFLFELTLPLDPFEQYDAVTRRMAEGAAGGA